MYTVYCICLRGKEEEKMSDVNIFYFSALPHSSEFECTMYLISLPIIDFKFKEQKVKEEYFGFVESELLSPTKTNFFPHNNSELKDTQHTQSRQ
jgi:hypothetical protein